MKCELIKMKVNYTDKKGVKRFFYEYFLVFENGARQRVKPNVFVGKDGNTHDNRDTLNVLAREVDSIEEVKYGE